MHVGECSVGRSGELVHDGDSMGAKEEHLAHATFHHGRRVGLGELRGGCGPCPAFVGKEHISGFQLPARREMALKFLDGLEPLSAHGTLALSADQEGIVNVGGLLRAAHGAVNRWVHREQTVAIKDDAALIVMMMIAEMIRRAQRHDGRVVVPTAAGDEMTARPISREEA